MRQKQKGFTLIELLVAVAIVALLTNVVIIALNSSRAKARDAKRKVDVDAFRKGLELYYSDHKEYPNQGAVGNPNQETDAENLRSFLVPDYLSDIPKDPQSSIQNYQYVWWQNGSSYGLLVPYGNDQSTSCAWRSSGGNKNWFSKAPDCGY